MPDGLLGILKLCLLALLYLFFIRVLWAVGRQMRAPEPTHDLTMLNVPRAGPEPARRHDRRRRKGELVVVAGVRKGQRFAVADEMTIGRAAGCHILIDDTFVSQLHARVFHVDGVTMVEDLGSTNGTAVNDVPVRSPVPLAKGDRLRIGDSVLELR